MIATEDEVDLGIQAFDDTTDMLGIQAFDDTTDMGVTTVEQYVTAILAAVLPAYTRRIADEIQALGEMMSTEAFADLLREKAEAP